LLVCSSYSYSEQVNETSTNAAALGLNWVMTNILPQNAGLTVNGIVYRYTTVKNAEDDMVVYVQNEDAINGGYIFRNADDWSGLPGNSINKLVPVNSIPLEYWGDGSIEVEGEGSVEDATVLYNYSYDTCFGVTTDPSCPDYIPPVPEIPEIEIYDPLDDQWVQKELEEDWEPRDEDEEDRDRRKMMSEEEIEDMRLEKILGTVNNSLLASESLRKHTSLMAQNYIPVNYFDVLPDSKYEETVVLKDASLPDNKRLRRQNLAQQLLHQELVNLQYEK
jgi:hypothetical protein